VADRCAALLTGACLALPIAFSQSTHALEFEVRTVKKTGMRYLYVYDKPLADGKVEGFVTGDAQKLADAFARGGFREVWLNSGGGNLDEGFKMGRILRARQAFVRVAEGMSCVSSCSVAFLGGVVRVVDPGATYEVHMFSSYSQKIRMSTLWKICQGEFQGLRDLFPKLTESELPDSLEALRVKRPEWFYSDLWSACTDRDRLEHALPEIMRKAANEAGTGGVDLFLYFYEMRGGHIGTESRRALESIEFSNMYSHGRDVKQDVQAIQTEGVVALTRLLMDQEVSAVKQVRDTVAARGDLDKAATVALKQLDQMLSTRIMHTHSLSRPQLEGLNYDNLMFE